jgi:hypothetical protein
MQACNVGDDQIVIRKPDAADFETWRALWNRYNEFYGRFGDTALPEEITRTTWSRFFDPYEPMHAFVAEQAGQLVGLAHCLFHRSTIQLHPNCYFAGRFYSGKRPRQRRRSLADRAGVCLCKKPSNRKGVLANT